MTLANLIAIAAILGFATLQAIESEITSITPGASTMIEGVWVCHRQKLNTDLGERHSFYESVYDVDGKEFEFSNWAAHQLLEVAVREEVAAKS